MKKIKKILIFDARKIYFLWFMENLRDLDESDDKTKKYIRMKMKKKLIQFP